VIGTGEKVNSVRKALEVLSSDVVASVGVIHGVCRRLASCPNERIWRPLLDDALLRSHLGYFIGQLTPDFGAGRGMLAGFAGRIGLVILIADGDLESARRALELLASGVEIKTVGLEIYDCEPLHVSALALSACGCGRDAAFGTVGYSSSDPFGMTTNEYQRRWLAAFTVVEMVRVGKIKEIDARYWEILGFTHERDRFDLDDLARLVIRRGHGWNWILRTE
jgi:hypothetical protein